MVVTCEQTQLSLPFFTDWSIEWLEMADDPGIHNPKLINVE